MFVFLRLFLEDRVFPYLKPTPGLRQKSSLHDTDFVTMTGYT